MSIYEKELTKKTTEKKKKHTSHTKIEEYKFIFVGGFWWWWLFYYGRWIYTRFIRFVFFLSVYFRFLIYMFSMLFLVYVPFSFASCRFMSVPTIFVVVAGRTLWVCIVSFLSVFFFLSSYFSVPRPLVRTRKWLLFSKTKVAIKIAHKEFQTIIILWIDQTKIVRFDIITFQNV